MTCIVCNSSIPQERLELVPNCCTCVKCSSAKPVRGLMDFSHKTAPVLVLLPQDSEQQRLAIRAFKRAR